MSAPTTTTSAREWCRCGDPLPPRAKPMTNDWSCSACGHERRYVERISVSRGGIVNRCGNCRYEARKTDATVPLTLCRFVTMTTVLAGERRSSDTYYLCDACADAEVADNPDADVIDGRQHT